MVRLGTWKQSCRPWTTRRTLACTFETSSKRPLILCIIMMQTFLWFLKRTWLRPSHSLCMWPVWGFWLNKVPNLLAAMKPQKSCWKWLWRVGSKLAVSHCWSFTPINLTCARTCQFHGVLSAPLVHLCRRSVWATWRVWGEWHLYDDSPLLQGQGCWYRKELAWALWICGEDPCSPCSPEQSCWRNFFAREDFCKGIYEEGMPRCWHGGDDPQPPHGCQCFCSEVERKHGCNLPHPRAEIDELEAFAREIPSGPLCLKICFPIWFFNVFHVRFFQNLVRTSILWSYSNI